jgi:glycosyltransferase involved in cell wall biosynthesis
MSTSVQISVVVPLYNEDESLQELEAWIRSVMEAHSFTYEILMVDDGSKDNSWSIIEKLAKQNPFVRGIKFRRNYGKSAALHMGFSHCKGDVVITMDADMQDSPDEIPELYKMITEQGYDLVSGWKKKRHDPISKTIPTKLFNGMTRWLSGIKLNDFNCGLKAYKSDVVKTIEVYGEMHRYIPVIAKWNGFSKIGEKVVQHRARKFGVTKFGGLERFIYGFLDLLSIMFVSKFSKRPMHFFGTLGTLFFTAGFGITAYLIVMKWYNLAHDIVARDVVNNTWFYLALSFAVIGVQLFLAGFLGEIATMNSSNKSDYSVADKVGL